MRPTPRTDERWDRQKDQLCGGANLDLCRTLERELAECKAENAGLKERHKKEYDAGTELGKLLDRKRAALKDALTENAALADALRVRIEHIWCVDCGRWLCDENHAETCRHFATERKVMEAVSSF